MVSLLHKTLASQRALSALAVSAVFWSAGAQAEIVDANCGSEIAASGTQPAMESVAFASQALKSEAILGQPSALERIRLDQQANEAVPSFAATAALFSPLPMPAQPPVPSLGGTRREGGNCLAAVLPDTTSSPSPSGSDDFLASKRLAVSRTAFDRDWRRASGDHVSARRFNRLVGQRGGDALASMTAVNAWVNQSITFTEDRDLFSRADYWAGASTTLRLRRGDCEDFALTKMQLLAAAGIPRENMILTITRDLVRNADHAVLIVRHNARFYMLDNATDEVLDASLSHDYRPILSYSGNQAWLHGS